MSTTYGPDRQKIYQYIEKQGLKVTDEIHQGLKVLLLEYVDHQNANLKAEAEAWHKHIPKCEMFLARKNNRKIKVNVVKKNEDSPGSTTRPPLAFSEQARKVGKA
jgi:hypothetical protein